MPWNTIKWSNRPVPHHYYFDQYTWMNTNSGSVCTRKLKNSISEAGETDLPVLLRCVASSWAGLAGWVLVLVGKWGLSDWIGSLYCVLLSIVRGMASVRAGWMDPEQTNYLSGLFQQIVEDCKVCHNCFSASSLQQILGRTSSLWWIYQQKFEAAIPTSLYSCCLWLLLGYREEDCWCWGEHKG